MPYLLVALECVDLPDVQAIGLDELRMGIQSGQLIEQDVPVKEGRVRFQFRMQMDASPDGSSWIPKGTYVHGPRRSSFLYLCWGERRNGQWQPHSRAKIALDQDFHEKAAQALASNQTLHARIRMSDAKGRPAAASLKRDAILWS